MIDLKRPNSLFSDQFIEYALCLYDVKRIKTSLFLVDYVPEKN